MMLIPIVFAATVAGLLSAPYFSLSTTESLTILLFGLLSCFLFHRYSLPYKLLLFLLFFLLANWRYPQQFSADQQLEKLTGPQKVSVVAELISVVHRAGERTQLDLLLISFETGDSEQSIPGRVHVRLYIDQVLTGLLPGDVLKFSTRFREPRLFGTPGEFHWPRYLASQGIALTGWLKNADQLTAVGQVWRLNRGLMRWKEEIGQRISASVPNVQSSLVRALLLGESKLLADPLRQILSRAGISHLFAISGLHLGLIALFSYRLLLFAYRRVPFLLEWQPPQRVLPVCLLPLLLWYLLLTGDAVSTRRALGVAMVAAGFWWLRYTTAPQRLLLFLATLFLLVNPLLLWQAGWQLSFAGAAGIIFWKPLWQDKVSGFRKIYRWPLSMLLVTAAATLATLPFLLLNFHLVALVGLLANFFAVPIVTLLALPIGLCGLFFSWAPIIADYVFQCCGWLLAILIAAVENLLHFPGAAGEYLFLSDGQHIAVFLLVVPILLAPQCRIRQTLRLTSASWLAALLIVVTPISSSADLTMYLFSVGQGESMLLTNKQQAILIDGGGLYSDRYDVGQRLLAPALGKLGIRRLDAVLLTHDHPDHRKGLVFVLREFTIGEFWSAAAEEELHPSLKKVLTERSIPFRQVPQGWSAVAGWRGSDMSLYNSRDSSNKNNSSVVLHLLQEATGLMLTGDLEKAGVERLLRSEPPGPVDLLKLPHHGSKHSATERLVNYYQPEACLVSAGYKNRYQFPAAKLVAELELQAIPLYRTDLIGTVRARLSAGVWEVDHWDRGLFR